MRLFLVILLSIFIFACSSNKTQTDPDTQLPLTIRIDKTFPQDKQELIYEAVTEWSLRTDNSLKLTFVVTDTLYEDTTAHRATISVFNKEPGSGLLGWTNWAKSIRAAKIYAHESIENGKFFVIMKHEFGHAFGLYHDAYPSIMSTSVNADKDIQCEDVAKYCLLWSCNPPCLMHITPPVIPVRNNEISVCELQK